MGMEQERMYMFAITSKYNMVEGLRDHNLTMEVFAVLQI
jgi:hypothetical protein